MYLKGGGKGAAHSIAGLNEGVVDGNDLDLGVLNSVAEDDTSNSTEAVDADLVGSHYSGFVSAN